MRWDPHCVVEVGGTRFDSWRDDAYFASVSVTLSTGEASEFSWSVHDPDYLLLDRWIAGDGLAPLEARVWLGLGAELGPPVFDGLLAGAEWRDGTTGFQFFDRGYLMRRRKETEYHRNLDDVGIIAKLARQNDLAFEGPQPAVKLDRHKSVIQDAQTDWEFASERAEDAGLVLYVRGRTLYAKEAAKTSEPVVSLTLGEDYRLLDGCSFRYRSPENQEGRPGSVRVRARGKGGRRLEGKSDVNARGTSQTEIRRDLSIKTKRQADRRAEAKKALSREHAFTGRVALLDAFRGRRPDIRDTVEVLGLGKLFSGKYIAEEVHHEFAPGNLSTEISLVRDIKAA